MPWHDKYTYLSPDLCMASISSTSRYVLKKISWKKLRYNQSYEIFEISKVGGFFFSCFLWSNLGSFAQPRDQLGSTWTQNKSCREFFSTGNRLSNFFEKCAVLAGDSGIFNFSGFLVKNRFSVKSKVVLLDKWHISCKTEFWEKVPFSPAIPALSILAVFWW